MPRFFTAYLLNVASNYPKNGSQAVHYHGQHLGVYGVWTCPRWFWPPETNWNHSLLSSSTTLISTTLPKNEIWGSHRLSLIMPYSLRSKAPGPVPDGPGFWKPTETIHHYPPLQLLFQQLCRKTKYGDPTGCPWSCPTPWGLGGLDNSQMVLACQK